MGFAYLTRDESPEEICWSKKATFSLHTIFTTQKFTQERSKKPKKVVGIPKFPKVLKQINEKFKNCTKKQL